MEQQPVKVAVIFGVLVIAIIAALTFKREKGPPTGPATPRSPITVNKPVVESPFDERLSRLTGDIQNAPSPRTSGAVIPVDLDTPPPPLPERFTREPSPDLPKPAPFSFDEDTLDDEAGPRKHRVRDGDTLENLAERFLGDATRAQELLEANRESIANPELLPIGAELVIPAAKSVPHDELDEEELVPVAPAR
jgi:nucleoid-associated protein YgaU